MVNVIVLIGIVVLIILVVMLIVMFYIVLITATTIGNVAQEEYVNVSVVDGIIHMEVKS